MRIPIRYFSIGLLTASIVLLIMYVVTDDSSQAIDNLSVEELSSALEEHGYRTISQDDFISYSIYLDEEKAKEDTKKDDKALAEKSDKNNEKDSDKKTDDKKDKNDSDQDATEKQENDKREEQEETEEKSSKKVTISVEQGFVSQDIAKVLKEQGIIEDENKFVKYMEDNGYSSYIQIGKFTVNSDMNNKQLAETLTTYPGN